MKGNVFTIITKILTTVTSLCSFWPEDFILLGNSALIKEFCFVATFSGSWLRLGDPGPSSGCSPNH